MTARSALRAAALEARATGQPIPVGPELLLELLDDQVAVELADLRQRAAVVRASMPVPSVPMVHVLHHGKALCGKPGSELDGGDGHVWVSHADAAARAIVTCLACRKALGVQAMLEPRGRR